MRAGAKSVSIRSVYPVMGVYQGVMVHRRGPMTVGWELTFPEVYTMDEDDYDKMIENFVESMRMLPSWTVMHRQDVYTYNRWTSGEDPQKTGLLRQGYNANNEGRKYLTHRAYVFLTCCPKSYVDKDSDRGGLFGLEGLVNPPDDVEFMQFLDMCTQFIHSVCGSFITARKLTDEEWIGTRGIDSYNGGLIQDHLQLHGDPNIVSDIEREFGTIKCGNRRAVVYEIADSKRLRDEVSTISKIGALSSLHHNIYLSLGSSIGVRLNCEHVVNQIILIPDQGKLASNLTVERNKMKSGESEIGNAMNSEELQEVLRKMYKGEIMSLCHTDVIAWADEKDFDEMRLKTENAVKGMNIIASRQGVGALPCFYGTTPGCAFDIGIDHLMKQEIHAALCLGTYETYVKGMEGGTLRMTDRLTHVPVTFDICGVNEKLPQGKGHINASNAFAVGPTGTGKSFTINTILRNKYDAGHSVFIIDDGGSYELQTYMHSEETGGVWNDETCRPEGGRDGQYYSWSLAKPPSFNPFLGYEDWMDVRGILRQDNTGVNFILAFLKSLWKPTGGWDEISEPILVKQLVDFLRWWKEANPDRVPIFEDFCVYVETVVYEKFYSEDGYKVTEKLSVKANTYDINRFLIAVSPYRVGGDFGFLANNPNPPDLTASRWVVFDVHDLAQVGNKTFYSLCILFIMHLFDMKMFGTANDGVRKVLAIDEAWKALKNETFAPYIEGLYRVSRKYSSSILVITQDVDDIKGGSGGAEKVNSTIVGNSSVKILLDQSKFEDRYEDAAKLMAINNEKALRLLFSVGKTSNPYSPKAKDVFFAFEDGYCMVMNNEVSSIEMYAYESNHKDKEPIHALAKVNKSYTAAITALAGRVEAKKK